MNNCDKIESSKILNDKYFCVKKDRYLDKKGKCIRERLVKEGLGSAMIFAITKDQEIIIEEQYRFGIKKISFDLPCGRIEKKEDPLAAAQRELLEETNFQAKTWIYLGKLAYSPADSTEYLHVFLAKNLKKTLNKKLTNNEKIKLHFISFKELNDWIKKGKIFCCLCLAAIQLASIKLNINKD